MKKVIIFGLILSALELTGCASANTAQNFSMLAFDEKAKSDDLKSIGNIEGKDCTWYVLGYGVGEDPNVRNAFEHAMNQTEGSLIPGQAAKVKGARLKGVKNVSIENGGFNAYVASRRCITVTGVGLQ